MVAGIEQFKSLTTQTSARAYTLGRQGDCLSANPAELRSGWSSRAPSRAAGPQDRAIPAKIAKPHPGDELSDVEQAELCGLGQGDHRLGESLSRLVKTWLIQLKPD